MRLKNTQRFKWLTIGLRYTLGQQAFQNALKHHIGNVRFSSQDSVVVLAAFSFDLVTKHCFENYNGHDSNDNNRTYLL